MVDQSAGDTQQNEDRFNNALKAINAAVAVMPEFYQLLEERKQRSGMSTAEILARAGVRFGENDIMLLLDLARLTMPTARQG